MLEHIATAVSSLLVAVIAVAILAAPAPAAPRGATVALEVRSSGRVAWVESEFPRVSARRVRIEVFAPSPDGRSLWQYCGLEYAGPGAYRCGVDISRGTRARRLRGSWEARLRVDGDLEARERFRLTR
ncbi:MAG: hypothetical protein ACREJS_06005 [Candidatus Rokuibacteriota bacterium]